MKTKTKVSKHSKKDTYDKRLADMYNQGRFDATMEERELIANKIRFYLSEPAENAYQHLQDLLESLVN